MADPQFVFDGNLEFSGGQDASKSPHLTPKNALFAGVNLTMQDGVVAPRPGFNQLEFILPEGGVRDEKLRLHDYATIFKAGRFQALIPYQIGQEFFLIYIIAGIVFLINQDTYVVTVLEFPDGSHLNANAPRINWSPASRFLVIFDFPAFPAIVEGATIRRADPADFEVPVSTLGAYNQNRLFIANSGNEFTAGDPTGNTLTPDAPITFEEVEAPASPFFGDIYQLPTDYNNKPITAMTFLQFTDTSTGIGPLLISTSDQIFSYQSQLPRVSWLSASGGQTGTGFGTAFIHDAGIAGPRAFTHVNSDLFFLSSDGQIRSVAMSRDEQKKWSKTPISREVKNWLKYWDESLIPFAVMGYFDNKILATANPYRVPSHDMFGNYVLDVAFGGLVVIEMDNVSTLIKESQPAWAGLWTGVRPQDICVNNKRCFIASKDSDSVNHIYELLPDATVDTLDGRERQVRSIIYTREYDCNEPFSIKQLSSLDLVLNDVQGKFDIELSYRPSHAPKYLPWGDFKHYAPAKFCNVPDACDLEGLVGHSFMQLIFGFPSNMECNPVTNDLYRVFRMLQLKLIITGDYWQIEHLRLAALMQPQTNFVTACNVYNPVKLCGECSDDWIIPEITLC